MFYVYILESIRFGKYYVGCTNDINDRINKHNNGHVFWTKIYRPWRLIYNEQYMSLPEARKRESQIKSWHKRAEIEKLIKDSTL